MKKYDEVVVDISLCEVRHREIIWYGRQQNDVTVRRLTDEVNKISRTSVIIFCQQIGSLYRGPGTYTLVYNLWVHKVIQLWVYAITHPRMRGRMHVCIYMHVGTYVCTYVCMRLCVSVSECVDVCMYVCTYVCELVSICMYVCGFVCTLCPDEK